MDEWMLSNRKGFPEWMARTFTEYPSKGRFFPHQQLVRDYMQFESPYRGILLYHGLGVGKTCASIAAAEAYVAHGRKVIVMVPAALATNYRQEIMKCASVGNPSGKLWNLVDIGGGQQKWIPGTLQAMKAYGAVLRKRVAFKNLTEEEKVLAMSTLQDMADKAFTFVNYNGLTNKAWDELNKDGKFFEDAFVVMDEAHNFISRVANGGKVARRIYEAMMDADGIKMVMLTGTPVINHPYELGLLLSVIRGPLVMYTFSLGDGEDIRTILGEQLLPFVDSLSQGDGVGKITLCPQGFVLDHSTGMVHPQEWKWDKIVATIRQKLKRPVKQQMAYALPTGKEEFETTFMDMTDPDAPKVKNMNMFMRRIMGLVSYFRTSGEEHFPQVTRRTYEPVEMSDFQFRTYNKVRGVERKMEQSKKRAARMAPVPGVFGSKGTVYRAFSRMACNFVFPDDIERKYPMDIRQDMKRVLQKEIDAVEEDQDNADAAEETPSDHEKSVLKTYEAGLKTVMKQLKERSAEIVSMEPLQKIYSPKMARMLEHIRGSPGKTLVYSQFRMVEGLGVTQVMLENAGYVRLEVTKRGHAWGIVNAEEVLLPKYDGKRYVVFDGDRAKIKVLLHLFNGEHDALPKELQDVLEENVATRRRGKLRRNLHGELASVLMITQSGAEGISLKCVRRVLIMEPFWNAVRTEQVIGRAVRTNSHAELPKDQRTVDVFIYTTIFTEAQLKKDFTLKTLDNGLTSDAHILRIAQNKDEIIQTFLNHMKMAALDCRNHAEKNDLMRHGMRCFAFPIPTAAAEEGFLPDTKADVFFTSRQVRTRKVQGRVALKDNKKYVVVEEYPGKLFDYSVYKHAGVLQEVRAFISTAP